MNKVHLTLQGKGGVGKSFVSALLTQYLLDQAGDAGGVVCVDTDPVNATLRGYKSLEARRLELMDGNSLNERKFDELMEMLLGEDATFVIDNGASSFLPLSNYIIENDAINVLGENGRQVMVHTVVTGGQAMEETLRGFQSLATQLPPEAQLVVWLNEYFGAIELADGRGFEEFRVYTDNKDRVHGLIRIPRQTSATFGRDVEMLLEEKMTFADAAASSVFGLMAKQRLSQVKKALYDQMRAVGV